VRSGFPPELNLPSPIFHPPTSEARFSPQPPYISADDVLHRGLEMTRTIALALGLAAAAPIAANAQTTPPREPRSCQQMHEETTKCETGMRSCDQRVIARLEKQCQRDEKRLPQVLEPRDGGRP
jgi:hypothetical protein